MAVLASSDPPSSGAFHTDLAGSLDPVLDFLHQNGAPLMINPYPFFAYASDTRPETLAFCLFQPNPGRVDAGSGLTYTNMFDAQLDAVRAALDAKGYSDVDIVIAETGWPYKGDADEAGATVDNAKAYNGNLVAHLKSQVGTPRTPGKSVDTYLFALYDEDLKAGPVSERSFGLYQTDLTANYDIGLAKSGGTAAPANSTPQPQVLRRFSSAAFDRWKQWMLLMLFHFVGHAAAEQGVDADGVLCDDVWRAGRHAGPTSASEQLVLRPSRSRVAAGRRQHTTAYFAKRFAVSWNRSQKVDDSTVVGIL
jgi:hypothetical protein